MGNVWSELYEWNGSENDLTVNVFWNDNHIIVTWLKDPIWKLPNNIYQMKTISKLYELLYELDEWNEYEN